MTKTTKKKPPVEVLKKRGRPFKDVTRKQMSIRLLDDEWAAFGEFASARGLDTTAWMRQVCRQACGMDPE